MPKFKPCRNIDGDDTRKQLYFKRIDQKEAELLKQVNSIDKAIEIEEGQVEIGYENMSMVEVLRIIMLSGNKE